MLGDEEAHANDVLKTTTICYPKRSFSNSKSRADRNTEAEGNQECDTVEGRRPQMNKTYDAKKLIIAEAEHLKDRQIREMV